MAHAARTTVDASKSRSQIDRLLREAGCDGACWRDHWSEGTSSLEFIWKAPSVDRPMLCRFEFSIGELSKTKADQEWRRLHRVLRIFLLGLFEAVEAGLLTMEEALLPWIVIGSGKTVAEEMIPRLAEIPNAPALMSGKSNTGE